MEAALVAARDPIFNDAEDVESRRDVSWVDALSDGRRSQAEGAKDDPTAIGIGCCCTSKPTRTGSGNSACTWFGPAGLDAPLLVV